MYLACGLCVQRENHAGMNGVANPIPALRYVGIDMVQGEPNVWMVTVCGGCRDGCCPGSPECLDGRCSRPIPEGWPGMARGQPDAWTGTARGQPDAWTGTVRGQSWRDGQLYVWTTIDKNACRRHATSRRPEGTAQYSEGGPAIRLRRQRRRNPGCWWFPNPSPNGAELCGRSRSTRHIRGDHRGAALSGLDAGTPGNQGCGVVPTPYPSL